MNRAFLIVLLILAGCVDHTAPVVSHGVRRPIRTAQVHLAKRGNPNQIAKLNSAERDVQLAQDTLLSKTPGSAEQAAALYRRAAARGSAVADYNLGVFYEEGIGVRADQTEAVSWYRRAIAGNDRAVERLASNRLSEMTVLQAEGE